MQVSAFVDGELPENEAELLVRRLSQDAVLRQQVAEYLAIGRIMRGEYSARGSDVLRERIAAELEERPLQEAADTAVIETSSRYVRPLSGFAIAATVALVAIFGLRQTIGVDDDPLDVQTAAEEVTMETVPAMNDEELRPLWLLYGKDSPSFNARWTALQTRAEELVEESTDEPELPADEAEEVEPVSNQP
jgi:negative regulator of sigma E activity